MMKKFLVYIFIIFNFKFLLAEDNALFFVEKALINNPKINAEKENLKAIKQNQNISRSEFLPSLTVTGTQTNTSTSNIIDHTGTRSGDISRSCPQRTRRLDRKKKFTDDPAAGGDG